MTGESTQTIEHFSTVAASYSQYRPSYPPRLAASLASLVPGRQRALDVGCGTGQFSVLLAKHFAEVLATDASAEQIAHAIPHPKIRYQCEPAEKTSAVDGSVNLITAAQAAHWFALPDFYAEVLRVASADAVVALISYGVLTLQENDLNACFRHFYRQDIGPYWPAGRHHVETGYRELDFPFEELTLPAMRIERDWDLNTFLGYVRTWSALRQVKEQGADDLILAFEHDIAELWGEPDQERHITWPIALRAGRVTS